MKTFCLITMIVVFLLISSNSSQAQTTQPKLNQVELMKQDIGSWKCDFGKDTTAYWIVKSFGTGYEGDIKFVTKGNVIKEIKYLMGYDKNIDKFISAQLTKGEDIELNAACFITKNQGVVMQYKDISNPEQASWKVETVHKSSDMHVDTYIVNGKKVGTQTWIRIK
jgi:hypothetical protein